MSNISFCLPSIEYVVFFNFKPNDRNVIKIVIVANISSGISTFNCEFSILFAPGLIRIRSGVYVANIVPYCSYCIFFR